MKISNLFESEKKFTTSYYNKNGERHREDGPAIINSDGNKAWWLNGERHRDDGPAFLYSDGSKAWWLNGKRHREDGPAVINSDGSKTWWLNGKRHREDGPAFIWADGSKEWWLNGERHREDGPAAIYPDGSKAWYIRGHCYGEGDTPPGAYNEELQLLQRGRRSSLKEAKRWKTPTGSHVYSDVNNRMVKRIYNSSNFKKYGFRGIFDENGIDLGNSYEFSHPYLMATTGNSSIIKFVIGTKEQLQQMDHGNGAIFQLENGLYLEFVNVVHDDTLRIKQELLKFVEVFGPMKAVRIPKRYHLEAFAEINIGQIIQ